jgi:hypothetical protein
VEPNSYTQDPGVHREEDFKDTSCEGGMADSGEEEEMRRPGGVTTFHGR